MKRWLALLLAPFTLVAFCANTLGAGLIVVDEAYWWPPERRPPVFPPPQPPRPRPWPRPPHVHAFAPLEITRHQSAIRVRDQVAEVDIQQDFRNPNPARMEGTFLFPIPTGAQLRKFTMEINGQATEAELLPADKARGIYEDIVRKLKDPALLEYAGQDVYKVRIFPIEPHETKRLRMVYTQLLRADAGLIELRYPLSAERFSAKPIPNLSVKVELDTRRPLKSVYSPSHTVEIRRHGATGATIGFEARDTRPETDFQLYYSMEDDPVGVNLMTFREGSEDGYFLLLLSPGLESRDRRVVPKDVVFVLDTSGSMAGRKLDQARKALEFCVANLNDPDRFEIIRFSTETEPMFGKLAEAGRANRDQATRFIQGLKPIGGTAIDDALRQALRLRPDGSDRPFVIIFLTDGLPTIGETAEDRILAHVKADNRGQTRVFCFGIGHDVNTHLLDQIAGDTRAFSQYVLPEEDLEVKVSTFFSKIKDPVLVEPALQFTGGIRTTRLHPATLPDLFQGEQLVVVGRYSGDGAAAVILEGQVEGATRKFSQDVRFTAEDREHDFIPRLWATRRVGYLLDQIRLHGESGELRDEVSELARRYGIVTPYTAYLIVEDEARRAVPLAQQSMPRLQSDAPQRRALADNYRETLHQRYGLAPVSRARSEQALKAAEAPAAAIALGAAEGRRGLAPDRADAAPLGVPGTTDAASTPSRQTQFAGGRTFYWNDGQWIDSTIQRLRNPRRVALPVGSSDYFDLLRREPAVAAWLALGTRVQFALGDTVYEVTDAEAAPAGGGR